jgi:hypothetical protein
MSARDYGWKRVGKATNWHKGGVIKHEKQPFMMGEGVGNCLGLEGPRYTLDAKTIEGIEESNREYFSELAQARRKKKSRERDQRDSFQKVLASKEASGDILVDQRIFYTEWVRKGWEHRADQYGGLPKEIDIAWTEFGMLLMVPVIEEDTAAEMGIDKKVPGVKQRTDSFGRQFWIRAELKDLLSKVFGVIRWERPLGIQEAKQFGVRVQ